ncbi:MAG: hypothetical protein DRJ41_02545 [Thermoprotei archaeon]|nr:MAG: hypothetical protein DRJ41_02545 [Thermoprotei archaeon]
MYRAVVFDVDGVLTEIDSIWKFIHERLGTWDKAKKYAMLFKKGKIDYIKWAELDVALWRGIPFSEIEKIVQEVKIRKGAKELINFLKQKGLKTFAISAGLDVLTAYVAEALKLDKAVSNELIVKEGTLTGEVKVKVLYNNKDKVLRDICKKEGIKPSETIAIGDSEVDLPMMEQSGFSIAINPSSYEVARKANLTIYLNDLRELIPVMKALLS